METCSKRGRRPLYTEDEDEAIEHWAANPPTEVKHLSPRTVAFWDKVLEVDPNAFQRSSNSLAGRYANLHPKKGKLEEEEEEEEYVAQDDIQDSEEPTPLPTPTRAGIDADVAAFLAYGQMSARREVLKRDEQNASVAAVSTTNQCQALRAALQKASDEEIRCRKALAQADEQSKLAADRYSKLSETHGKLEWSLIVYAYVNGATKGESEWKTFLNSTATKTASERSLEQARAALEAARKARREAQSILDAEMPELNRLSGRVRELRQELVLTEQQLERLAKQLATCASSTEQLLAHVAKMESKK